MFEKVTIGSSLAQSSSTTPSDPIKLASPLLEDQAASQQSDLHEQSSSLHSEPHQDTKKLLHEETTKSSLSSSSQKETDKSSDSPLSQSVRIRSRSSTSSQASSSSQDSPKPATRHSSVSQLRPAMRDSPLMKHHRVDSPTLPTISSFSPSPPSSPHSPAVVTRPSSSIPDTVPLQFLQRSAEVQ